MKNRKIKKLLIASVMGIVSLAMPLTLTGCSNTKTNIDQFNFHLQTSLILRFESVHEFFQFHF